MSNYHFFLVIFAVIFLLIMYQIVFIAEANAAQNDFVYTSTPPCIICVEEGFYESALNAVNYGIVIGIIAGVLWKVFTPGQ